jgi:hypothetical protein
MKTIAGINKIYSVISGTTSGIINLPFVFDVISSTVTPGDSFF